MCYTLIYLSYFTKLYNNNILFITERKITKTGEKREK